MADYANQDDKRAKAADELMWLEFETRMRGLIRRVVEPALKLSLEDRENNLELEMKIEAVKDRTDLLEQALFQKNKQLSRTIFDDYTDKMSEMNIFLLQESKKLQDTLIANKKDTEEHMFTQD